MKMEKTPRYTQRERNMVLGFAAQYKDVIENKRTDAESNRKKDEVWRQIAKEFNCRVYHQRSSKQLRQLYKNMKLLLKKDLCGGSTGGGVGGGGGAASVAAQESKGNRSFMDILNALSQQDSVTQYIAEQMSPSGYSSSRQQKYDDDFDDSKMPCGTYDGLDNDVIVIKSEDISDNEHSQNGVGDMDDDDEDDCLSTKDIPEVCLEEEDDEIFATDLRRQSVATQQQQALQISTTAQHQQQQQQQRLQPDITIQNVGGIRVGSIGNIASLTNAAKALQNNSSSNNNNSSSNNNNINNNSALNISLSSSGNNQRSPVSSTEQQQRDQQQQLLFRGLGLSAVHNVDQQQQQSQQQLPTLQHATQRATPNNISGNSNGLLALSSNYAHIKSSSNNHNYNNNNSGGGGSGGSKRNNDYLLSLDIEERKRKIDLLNAQIDYWKTLTKKLDANSGHNPTPSCLCHFPASAASSSSNKINGLHTQHSSSSS